jgi:integrase
VTKSPFRKVGLNLYRYEPSGVYYCLIKRGDKQFRRSLKTADRKLADRRLADLRAQVAQLQPSENPHATFDEVAFHWLETVRHTMKASSASRREGCIRAVSPFLRGLGIRNVTPRHCEEWVTKRGSQLAPQTFAHELDTMRLVFEYAIAQGLLLTNPAKRIKRRRIVNRPIEIPTREQFQKLMAAIRHSDGRPGSQEKAREGGDLVELMAYSGCRLEEARALRWEDVDFEKGLIRVTGGEHGTKNHEVRLVPMTEALRGLLQRMRKQSKGNGFLVTIKSARKCLETASRRLEIPRFTHHDFRHFFATTCIESGVDIPTVSKWLGHRDGGALAMKVYGHLRQDHSLAMIKRVSF